MNGNKEMNEKEVNKVEKEKQENMEDITPEERMEQVVAELEEEHRKEKELTRPAYWRGLMTGVLICAFVSLIMMFSVSIIVKKKANQTYKVIDTSGSQATIHDIENKLSSLEELVNQYYYYTDKVDMNVIAEQIYSAYMNGLKDKYAAYYTKDEMTQRIESVNGAE